MTKAVVAAILITVMWPCCTLAAELSTASSDCLECHRSATPGAVADWERSRHSQVTLKQATAKPSQEKRVSSAKAPDGLADVVISCAECHTINPRKHHDTFEHEGYNVHVIVTPQDCALCHPTEVKQYSQNLMSHAHGNLNKNPVYHDLMKLTNGVAIYEEDKKITYRTPDDQTNAESCNYCHGTEIEVKGNKTRDTDFGEMAFPIMVGWPNQGVGRINPDGSKGSCAACHTRHQFSIQMAREPYTCAECHKGPDVPAYKVYEVSKHGAIYSSLGEQWNTENVPWIVGKDFTAPTCAVCHVSLVTTEEGETIAERTHQMNNRLPWRLFGLIYAHPHPQSPDTTVIKNKDGLALPTELTGEPVAIYLIDAQEQEKRRRAMQKICLSCHHTGWVEEQWSRFEHTIKTTNESTLTATKIMFAAWDSGVAMGRADDDSIFNEAFEKKWVEHWLFFANSVRLSSAMAGADYGVFAQGRWYMNKNIQEMADWLELKQRAMQ